MYLEGSSQKKKITPFFQAGEHNCYFKNKIKERERVRKRENKTSPVIQWQQYIWCIKISHFLSNKVRFFSVGLGWFDHKMLCLHTRLPLFMKASRGLGLWSISALPRRAITGILWPASNSLKSGPDGEMKILKKQWSKLLQTKNKWKY